MMNTDPTDLRYQRARLLRRTFDKSREVYSYAELYRSLENTRYNTRRIILNLILERFLIENGDGDNYAINWDLIKTSIEGEREHKRSLERRMNLMLQDEFRRLRFNN